MRSGVWGGFGAASRGLARRLRHQRTSSSTATIYARPPLTAAGAASGEKGGGVAESGQPSGQPLAASDGTRAASGRPLQPLSRAAAATPRRGGVAAATRRRQRGDAVATRRRRGTTRRRWRRGPRAGIGPRWVGDAAATRRRRGGEDAARTRPARRFRPRGPTASERRASTVARASRTCSSAFAAPTARRRAGSRSRVRGTASLALRGAPRSRRSRAGLRPRSEPPCRGGVYPRAQRETSISATWQARPTGSLGERLMRSRGSRVGGRSISEPDVPSRAPASPRPGLAKLHVVPFFEIPGL